MPDICKVEQYQSHTFMQSTYGKISKMKWQFANLQWPAISRIAIRYSDVKNLCPYF